MNVVFEYFEPSIAQDYFVRLNKMHVILAFLLIQNQIHHCFVNSGVFVYNKNIRQK